MQQKKENLAIGLRIKELRKRLGLDRAEFCEKFGGVLAYNTLKNIELGTQKPGRRILSALEVLEKGGSCTNVSMVPAASAPEAAVSARGGGKMVAVGDLEENLLTLFRQLDSMRKIRLVASLDDEVSSRGNRLAPEGVRSGDGASAKKAV